MHQKILLSLIETWPEAVSFESIQKLREGCETLLTSCIRKRKGERVGRFVLILLRVRQRGSSVSHPAGPAEWGQTIQLSSVLDSGISKILPLFSSAWPFVNVIRGLLRYRLHCILISTTLSTETHTAKYLINFLNHCIYESYEQYCTASHLCLTINITQNIFITTYITWTICIFLPVYHNYRSQIKRYCLSVFAFFLCLEIQ